jgi:integral membrane protein
VNPATVRTVFRTVAIAEAVSWGLLLVAMFFKWVLDAEPLGLAEGGVPVAGPIHGVVFMLYVVSAIVSKLVFRWDGRTLLVALVSSIPPFATVWFERKADREGRLSAPAQAGATSAP